eukprot:55666-Ditylum_brightwellii.AAC.1
MREVKTKYTNLGKITKCVDPKDANILALTTKLDNLEKMFATNSGSNGGGKLKSSGKFNSGGKKKMDLLHGRHSIKEIPLRMMGKNGSGVKSRSVKALIMAFACHIHMSGKRRIRKSVRKGSQKGKRMAMMMELCHCQKQL